MRRLLIAILLLAACVRTGPLELTAEGARLSVPPGADDGTDVAINVDPTPPVAPPDDRIQLSAIYALTPHGHVFSQPVQLQIPYTVNNAVMPTMLRLGDDIDDIWQDVSGVGFDAGVASFSTDHFSWYGVFGPPGSRDPLADDDDATADDDDAANDDDSVIVDLAYDGDLTVTNEDEMAAFCAEYNRTTGDLTISGTEFETVGPLSCLVEVGGTLTLDSTEALDVTLPNLVRIGQRLYANANDELETLAAPSLELVGSDIFLAGSSDLATLDLSGLRVLGGVGQFLLLPSVQALDVSSLVEVGGSLTLSGMQVVDALEFDALTMAGGLQILEFGALQTLTFPLLAEVTGDLVVRESMTSGSLDFPLLTSVDGTFDLTSVGCSSLSLPMLETARSLDIDGVGALTSLSMPVFEGSSAGLLGLDGSMLTTLSLPAVTSVQGTLALGANNQLTAIDAPLLTTVGGIGFAGNNAALTFGLPALETVTGLFLVRQNELLEGLDFPALTLIDGGADIQDNIALGDDVAQAFIDGRTVNGLVTVQGNEPPPP